MQPGVFRQIDFAHAAGAQRRYDFVRTELSVISDPHIANVAVTEWSLKTDHILSLIEVGDEVFEAFQVGCEKRIQNLQTNGPQFATILLDAFDKLAPSSKYIHMLSLGLMGLTVILLMTPAAITVLWKEVKTRNSFTSHPVAAGFNGHLANRNMR